MLLYGVLYVVHVINSRQQTRFLAVTKMPYSTITIYFQLHISRKYYQNLQKPNRLFNRGPTSWKPQNPQFSHISEISRLSVDFTDSGSATAWVRDTDLH